MAEEWQPVCGPPSGLVAPVRRDAPGGPTRGAARGPRWRRVGHGLYVPAFVEDTKVEQRIIEVAARLADSSKITGWASLRLAGAAYFDGLQPDGRTRIAVPVACGALKQLRGWPGVRLSREQLAPEEWTERHGIPCTTIPRALFDEMRRVAWLRDAVVALDMAAAAGLVSLRAMAEYVGHRPAWTGVDRVRKALLLGEERSRSPRESRLRLVWTLDAGLPRPLCNRPIFDLAGNLIGTPDLLDPVAGLVGEYDGLDHRGAERHRSDNARYERFRDHRLEYVTVVTGEMSERGRLVRRLTAAHARSLFLDPGQRSWTLEPPAWWPPEPTLDEQLALHPRI
jgi:hypothetical protein